MSGDRDSVPVTLLMCDRWRDRDPAAACEKGSCAMCGRVIAVPRGVTLDRPTVCPVCVARIAPHAVGVNGVAEVAARDDPAAQERAARVERALREAVAGKRGFTPFSRGRRAPGR